MTGEETDQSAAPSGDGSGDLRYGWTTGACATAAAKAAATALFTGSFPDPVSIVLPGGQEPAFALSLARLDKGCATAAVIKDAGDDPDITHGATIMAQLSRAEAGAGIRFHAGEGVGMITKPGLPLPPGEPAINPKPREMISSALQAVCAVHKETADLDVTISVPGGEALAEKTWNPRLGIKGGLSILGTTGIVVPYSCAAWIHSIHRGIDVARAEGLTHVAGSTGNASEIAVQNLYDLPEGALLDMGDFAGGMLKYLAKHPVPRVTIAGGFGKMTKLAQGALDLHSSRSQVDFGFLADHMAELGADAGLLSRVRAANTANEVLGLAEQEGLALADRIADEARRVGLSALRGADIDLDLVIIRRDGSLCGESR